MLTAALFYAKFPEFQGVPQGQIEQYLSDAALEMDACVWGSLFDAGQGYLAAHALALSPFGQNAKAVVKTVNGAFTSMYEVNYRRLQREVSSGFRVT